MKYDTYIGMLRKGIRNNFDSCFKVPCDVLALVELWCLSRAST